MGDIDRFRYDGKRVLVVGGATGMGAAAAKIVASLGAEIIVMDHAPVEFATSQAISVDLRDLNGLNVALEQIEGPLHAIFNAAGVADGTPGIMKINFISHRHIIETLIGDGRLVPGSAVCLISSVGGLGWQQSMNLLLEFLATPDYTSASAWVDAHEGTDSYGFSKQAMNCYVARKSFEYLEKRIRINCICPGPTDTPLARANAEIWLGFGEGYRQETGTTHLTPEQMGDTMVFLNSAAASGISGVNLLVDVGHVMSSMTGAYEADKPVIDFLISSGFD